MNKNVAFALALVAGLISLGNSLSLKPWLDSKIFSEIKAGNNVYVAYVIEIRRIKRIRFAAEERMTSVEKMYGDPATPEHLWGSGFTRREKIERDQAEVYLKTGSKMNDSVLMILDTLPLPISPQEFKPDTEKRLLLVAKDGVSLSYSPLETFSIGHEPSRSPENRIEVIRKYLNGSDAQTKMDSNYFEFIRTNLEH